MSDDRRVKLLLTYDPLPENREAYFNYVLGEFVPALEHLGLTMSEAWHTAYGSYRYGWPVSSPRTGRIWRRFWPRSAFRTWKDV